MTVVIAVDVIVVNSMTTAVVVAKTVDVASAAKLGTVAMVTVEVGRCR